MMLSAFNRGKPAETRPSKLVSNLGIALNPCTTERNICARIFEDATIMFYIQAFFFLTTLQKKTPRARTPVASTLYFPCRFGVIVKDDHHPTYSRSNKLNYVQLTAIVTYICIYMLQIFQCSLYTNRKYKFGSPITCCAAAAGVEVCYPHYQYTFLCRGLRVASG